MPATASVTRSPDSDPERLWLPAHVQGDAAAFAMVVSAYGPRTLGYVRRSGVATADVEDVFQDIWATVHRGAHKYDATRPLAPWLFTVAANKVRSHMRRATLATHDADPETLTAQQAAGGFGGVTGAHQLSAHQIAAGRELATWIEAELQTLKDEARQIVLLCCVEQLTMKETAEALGIPEGTVKTGLHRARLVLARSLARRRATQLEAV